MTLVGDKNNQDSKTEYNVFTHFVIIYFRWDLYRTTNVNAATEWNTRHSNAQGEKTKYSAQNKNEYF